MLHQQEFLKDELMSCHTGIKKIIFANNLQMTVFETGLQEI
jgi:hypothetical protein